MIKSLLHSWLFSLPSLGGVLQPRLDLSQILQFLKKRYRGLKMKYRTLKLFQRRRNARKRIQTTDRAVQALIIGLALVMVLLVGCSYRMVPNETRMVQRKQKNDKLQQKQSIRAGNGKNSD